jgi:glucuronokinase
MRSLSEATGRANARAALVGNPSDGFGGATLAFALGDLFAEVEAEPAAGIELEAEGQRLGFAGRAELLDAARSGGYPPRGPLALMMAAAKRSLDRLAVDPGPADHGFRLQLRSTIPAQVGLAGSSAIVTATLRALGSLFERPIPLPELPTVALACEADELRIAAGPQDRVVQAHGGLLFMDFDPALAAKGQLGRYEALDPALLPPLVVAYDRNAASHSGAVHDAVWRRFEAGSREVGRTMAEIAGLAREARAALRARDHARLGELMDRNFDLRRHLYDLDPRHMAMIDTARALGASANYAGSGGAIVALAPAERSLDELRGGLEAAGCAVIAPKVAAPVGG